jgi:hypothetical protein
MTSGERYLVSLKPLRKSPQSQYCAQSFRRVIRRHRACMIEVHYCQFKLTVTPCQSKLTRQSAAARTASGPSGPRGRPPAAPAGPGGVVVNATDPLNLVGAIAPGDTVPAVRTSVVTYVDALPVASGAGAADAAEASGVDVADDTAPEVPDGPEAFDVLVQWHVDGGGVPMSDEAFRSWWSTTWGATRRFSSGFRCATSSRWRASRA